MKKLFFYFAILLGISLCLVSCYNEKHEVRIRILASNNEQSSIDFKYKIKDLTLIFLKETSYLEPKSLTSYLKNRFDEIYSKDLINVTFEQVTYPAKTLDGKFIPSGKYPTVLIKIGEGLGSNWWSILYPEFFGVSYESSNEVEYRSYFYDLFK